MHPKHAATTTFRAHLCLGTVNSRIFFLEFAGMLLIGIFTLPRNVQLPRLKEVIELDNPNLGQLVASLFTLPVERHVTGGKSE